MSEVLVTKEVVQQIAKEPNRCIACKGIIFNGIITEGFLDVKCKCGTHNVIVATGGKTWRSNDRVVAILSNNKVAV